MVESFGTLPPMTRVDVLLETSEAVCVWDLPAALEGAERDGLAPPPRPRAPLARLAPKQLSSASMFVFNKN